MESSREEDGATEGRVGRGEVDMYLSSTMWPSRAARRRPPMLLLIGWQQTGELPSLGLDAPSRAPPIGWREGQERCCAVVAAAREGGHKVPMSILATWSL
jgi:hypothetical protein